MSAPLDEVMRRFLAPALTFCILIGSAPLVRLQQSRTSQQSDDVIRVKSSLVQTDVMVFDAQGHFVEGLKKDQFELRIDGKPQPISFFERVKTGEIDEEAQLAAARGGAAGPDSRSNQQRVVPLDRGRTIFFFVDDLHLAAANVKNVRDTLLSFIDRDIGQNDEAAVTSASGQIGFLGQVTGDKAVLRAAVGRLKTRSTIVRDFDRPPMSELQAQAVLRNDLDVRNYFVERVLADNPGLPRQAAEDLVQRRAQSLLEQTAAVTTNSLAGLNNVVRAAGEFPGRKLLFFLSDGFLTDDQTSNVSQTMRRISDAAAKGGVVIYSVDARGLTGGTGDATQVSGIDAGGRLSRLSGSSEIISTQQALVALAADSGGRSLLNTNALSTAFSDAVSETSIYYLLAWQPSDQERNGKYRRIEVSVVGRPDLSIRVRRGFIDSAGPANAGDTSVKRPSQPRTVSEDLQDAIQARSLLTSLPTSLFVSYVSRTNGGISVTASTEIDPTAMAFTAVNGQQVAKLDVAGIVFSDEGKSVASFKTQLDVRPPAAGKPTNERGVVYNYATRLTPGLYQIRVAARDGSSGKMGSAVQWLEVPDLSTHRLYLSSIMLGERKPSSDDAQTTPEAAVGVFMSVARRFARNSRLRFVTQIYNAFRGSGGDQSPDVALQVQVFRDGQPVLTTALSKVQTLGVPDMTRLPYVAEIPLDTMPAGRYVLLVTVIDRIAKASATQRVRFEITS